jgi:hypothetical protein
MGVGVTRRPPSRRQNNWSTVNSSTERSKLKTGRQQLVDRASLILPEASLACQEPPLVAPDKLGWLLLDWAFASLASLEYVSLVVTTFDKL